MGDRTCGTAVSWMGEMGLGITTTEANGEAKSLPG